MQFYFDESGNFSRNDNQGGAFGVVASIIVPDAITTDVQHAYKNYVAGLSKKERKHGEPKGCLLSTESRSLFADLLAAFPDLLSYVVILDLSATQQNMYDYLPQGLRDTLDQQAKHLIQAEMRDRIELLAKQVANLSSAQF
ncbi:MAG: hypothetical protein IH895_05265, partial [Planctomycetes bacterium]|nr:hypothetical protein [Planctomycetota bacterium]